MDNETLVQEFFDIEKLSPLIKEYEHLIKALRGQIEFYKIEHESIRNQSDKLIIENNDLSDKLKNALSSVTVPTSVDSKLDTGIEIVANLQEQISHLLQEKNSALELWQQAQKEIDNLEDQIQSGGKQPERWPPDKECELKSCLDQVKHLENELEKHTKNYEDNQVKLTQQLEANTIELENSLAKHRKALDHIDECEQEINELQTKVGDLQTGRNELEEALAKCQKYIKDLQEKDAENIKIIDELRRLKETAVEKEDQYKDEIGQLQTALSDVIHEAGVKVKNEVESLNREFANKMKTILEDMHEIQMKYKDKTSEAEKLLARAQMLDEELQRYKNGKVNEEYEAKLLNVGLKLDTTIQKLVSAERKNMQLTSECDALRFDMNAMSRGFERDIQARQLENKNLERRNYVMQEELLCINKNFVQVVSECQLLTEQITTLERELKKRRENDELFQRIWEEYNMMEEHKEDKAKLLEEHVKSQAELNIRWKEELQDITGKFRKHIKQLNIENKELRQENMLLNNELTASKERVAQYIESVKKLSNR